MMLAAWGHRPLVTYDPAAAWEAALAHRPDVGLLDLGLPGISGWELARRLRAEVALAGMLLFAVTGYGRVADRQKSVEAGIFCHLVKPVEPDLLRRLLAGCGSRPAQDGGPLDPTNGSATV
jgi:two-component system CheB/CheR fusion protein